MEDYGLTAEGLRYSVHLIPEPQPTWLLVPVIRRDGQETSRISAQPSQLQVTYRGQVVQIRALPGTQSAVSPEPPGVNRNALCCTCRVEGTKVHIRLIKEGEH